MDAVSQTKCWQASVSFIKDLLCYIIYIMLNREFVPGWFSPKPFKAMLDEKLR